VNYLHPVPKPTRVAKVRKPLRRKRYMVKRRPRRLKRAGSDPAYLDFVRSLPCIISRDSFHHEATHKYSNDCYCQGATHAHHAGRKPGVAMKAPDSTAIPLCQAHHMQWHTGLGVFAGLSKLERFAWSQRAIAATQAARERG